MSRVTRTSQVKDLERGNTIKFTDGGVYQVLDFWTNDAHSNVTTFRLQGVPSGLNHIFPLIDSYEVQIFDDRIDAVRQKESLDLDGSLGEQESVRQCQLVTERAKQMLAFAGLTEADDDDWGDPVYGEMLTLLSTALVRDHRLGLFVRRLDTLFSGYANSLEL